MALLPNRNGAKAQDRKAKTQAAENEALMREVDDAVRTDQYRNIWTSYGLYIVGAIVLALLAFAAVLYFTNRSEGARESGSEALVTALDQVEAGNLEEADNRLAELAENGQGGARLQALMLRGGIAMEEGRAQEAKALFDTVAEDDDAPVSLRDLATLRAVAAGYDDMEPAEAIRRLTPLAQQGEPFYGSAAELLGMAYLDGGDEERAGSLFEQLAGSNAVPQTIRSRARQMASALGVDTVGDADELLESMRVPGGAGAGAALQR